MRQSDLQLLELSSASTIEDIEKAYQTLYARYSQGSLASYGLFSASERTSFLRALFDAYQRLLLSLSSEEYRLDKTSLSLSTPSSPPRSFTPPSASRPPLLPFRSSDS